MAMAMASQAPEQVLREAGLTLGEAGLWMAEFVSRGLKTSQTPATNARLHALMLQWALDLI